MLSKSDVPHGKTYTDMYTTSEGHKKRPVFLFQKRLDVFAMENESS